MSVPRQRWSAYALAAIMAMAVLVMFILRPWINPSLFQAALFVLGGIWAAAFVIRPFPLRFAFPMLPLATAVLWALLQLAAGWTASPADTRAAILVWTGNLLAFSLARQVCDAPDVRRRFLDVLLGCAFVIAVGSVLQFFSGGTLGPFLNHDQFAAFLEMLLPLALLRSPVIAAAMYAAIIAGGSRAGAILATGELLLVFSLARGRGKGSSLSPAWLLVPVFVAVVGVGGLWYRFRDPDPFRGRREMLRGAVSMIAAKPWGGFGLGSFPTTYPAYSAVDFGAVVNHAHNDWAEWAADGGIPFCLMLASIALWSAPRAWRSVWGIGLLAVFVHSLVDFPLQKPVLELWLFALLGALASAAPN